MKSSIAVIVVISLLSVGAVIFIRPDDRSEIHSLKIEPVSIPLERQDLNVSEANAAYDLGIKFADGYGADMPRAIEWFRKAAELGSAKGQSRLAAAYERGVGIQKNYIEALKWYGLAAGQNDADGQLGLGDLYAKGHAVKTNYAEAARWYQLAAEQDIAKAQYELGMFYLLGRGVQRDYIDAYFWLALGARSLDSAMEKRDEVAKYLTPDQLQSIRLRLDEWQINQQRLQMH